MTPVLKILLAITVLVILVGGFTLGYNEYVHAHSYCVTPSGQFCPPANGYHRKAAARKTPASKASLSSSCQIGDASVNDNGDPWGYNPGVADNNYTYSAYALSLTNVSSKTADVTGFSVVFYDSSGVEIGSGTQDASNGQDISGFITPGHSLTWLGWTPEANGSDNAGTVRPASCQLAEWEH